MADHTHAPDGPDTCFGCKAAYWRAGSGVGVSYQGGRQMFHDWTTRSYADNEVEMAARDGRTLVPADEYGNPR